MKMWQDMNLYWAWRGVGQPTSRPPFSKAIEHAKIKLPSVYRSGPKEGRPVSMHLAVNVIERGVKREVCRDELALLLKAGATAEMP